MRGYCVSEPFVQSMLTVSKKTEGGYFLDRVHRKVEVGRVNREWMSLGTEAQSGSGLHVELQLERVHANPNFSR